MPELHSYSEVDRLLDTWVRRSIAAPGAIPLHVLSSLLAEQGTHISFSELRFAFRDPYGPSEMTPEHFRDHAVPLLGAAELRRSHAFAFLAGGATILATAALSDQLRKLGIDDGPAEAVAAELDRDGDGLITLENVLSYLDEHGADRGYRASHVRRDRLGRREATPVSAPHAQKSPALSPKPRPSNDDLPNVSTLDMQIGFFRLLQGAAYRSFRESYSAHSETHLRARDLPYTVPDFTDFVRAATDFYLALDLVEGEAARSEFETLAQMVEEEGARLDKRIADWGAKPISPEMATAERTIAVARASLADHRGLLSDALEKALAMRAHGLAVAELSLDHLTRHELNRLRHMELAEEQGHGPARHAPSNRSYLDAWNAVLVSADSDRPDGAIMPVRFWYEQFMPQLLRCASIRNDAEAEAARTPDPRALSAWHQEQVARGAFDTYATDLRDGFAACAPPVQLALAQAWRLTAPYLNGLEKRREREEFGRDTGVISQYVAFVDVFLGRSDIADAEMRVSFPYYIGPAVWCFLHTAAERIEAMPDARDRAEAIDAFKRFFRVFAKMYPCPYCRYHLNRYVVQNAELQFYPVEFMLLGQKADKAPFDISLEDRLETISAESPGSLRLFLWKLHNAVSSSIARTEPWYHRESAPLYTTRFWPGLDAEIARLRALGLPAVALDRLEAIYGALKPAAHLSRHRASLQDALAAADLNSISKLATEALPDIEALEKAIEGSAFLTRAYAYFPGGELPERDYIQQDETYARSGIFIER